jgi:hypothetical protein
MTSRDLQYIGQSDFRGGICDNQENLNPKNQVLDARNVWTNLGTLVRRPGYSSVAQYAVTDTIPAGAANYVDGTALYVGSPAPFSNTMMTFSWRTSFSENTVLRFSKT